MRLGIRGKAAEGCALAAHNLEVYDADTGEAIDRVVVRAKIESYIGAIDLEVVIKDGDLPPNRFMCPACGQPNQLHLTKCTACETMVVAGIKKYKCECGEIFKARDKPICPECGSKKIFAEIMDRLPTEEELK